MLRAVRRVRSISGTGERISGTRSREEHSRIPTNVPPGVDSLNFRATGSFILVFNPS